MVTRLRVSDQDMLSRTGRLPYLFGAVDALSYMVTTRRNVYQPSFVRMVMEHLRSAFREVFNAEAVERLMIAINSCICARREFCLEVAHGRRR